MSSPQILHIPSDAFDEQSSNSGASGPRFKIFERSQIFLIVKWGWGSSCEMRDFSAIGIQMVQAKPASIPPAILKQLFTSEEKLSKLLLKFFCFMCKVGWFDGGRKN